MKNILYITFVVLAFSCKKDIGLVEVDNRFNANENNQFTTVWKNELSSDLVFPEYVDLIQNTVIYTSSTSFGANALIQGYNKTNGASIWSKSYSGSCTQTSVKGNTLFLIIKSNLVAIDGNTGNELWSFNTDYAQHFIIKNGTIFVFCGDSYSGLNYIKLYKINSSTGVSNLVLTQNTASITGVNEQRITSMSHWNHPNGNEIMYVQSSCEVYLCSKIYGIDITNDTIYSNLWHGGYTTLLQDHLIVGNTLYVNSVHLAVKYDMLNKSYDWLAYYGGQTNKNSMVLDNGSLYTSGGDNEDLEKIDVSDGSNSVAVDWTESLGNEHSKGKHLFSHNNKLYYSTPNALIIKDILSSEVTHRLNNGNTLNDIPVENFQPSFVVDPTTGYIYTGWRMNITCIIPN